MPKVLDGGDESLWWVRLALTWGAFAVVMAHVRTAENVLCGVRKGGALRILCTIETKRARRRPFITPPSVQ